MYNLVETMRQRCAGRALCTVGYGHLGDGNLHLNVIARCHSRELTDLIEPYVYQKTGRSPLVSVTASKVVRSPLASVTASKVVRSPLASVTASKVVRSPLASVTASKVVRSPLASVTASKVVRSPLASVTASKVVRSPLASVTASKVVRWSKSLMVAGALKRIRLKKIIKNWLLEIVFQFFVRSCVSMMLL